MTKAPHVSGHMRNHPKEFIPTPVKHRRRMRDVLLMRLKKVKTWRRKQRAIEKQIEKEMALFEEGKVIYQRMYGVAPEWDTS